MQQFIPQFNPYMSAQQRLYQMEQQYPQLSQPQSLTILPVTNIDEANAYRVDLNGTPTFFFNAGKNEIYLKRTNTQTGLADFQIFGRIEQPQSEVKENLGVNAYAKDFKALNDKIDGLYSLLSASQTPQQKETDFQPKGGRNVK